MAGNNSARLAQLLLLVAGYFVILFCIGNYQALEPLSGKIQEGFLAGFLLHVFQFLPVFTRRI